MRLTDTEKEQADKLFNDKLTWSDKRAYNRCELDRIELLPRNDLSDNERSDLNASIRTGKAVIEAQTKSILSLSMAKIADKIGCDYDGLKYYHMSKGAIR